MPWFCSVCAISDAMPPKGTSSPHRRRPARSAAGWQRTTVWPNSAPDVTAPPDDHSLKASPYRTLFLAHSQPMWFYDRTTSTVIDVNDAALAHYAMPRDGFLRTPASDLLTTHADRRADGRIFHADSHECDLGGGRALVLVALHDVTALRAAESALARAEEE